ncbi:MAG: DUF819 family protein [candidate division Zixibacteria bacterium]|nr:DUF819 family protein [candidate division Zixibacteria bacterium]MDH3939041.1 DUF819 family protein [candidate division Zixibacteria bacterium]
MNDTLITSAAGILAILAGVTSLFFFLEKKTQWTFFNYFPPLIFIYLMPVAFSNSGIIPTQSPVYDFMGSTILPMFLLIMLLEVDILATIRVMGKGVFVMLIGTLGVVIGAPIGFMLVKHGLGPEAWRAFGALAGSWIGGTGNMAAVAIAFDLDESTLDFGYAVIADNGVYLVWLPIMLASKSLAGKFNKFTGVSKGRLEQMEKAAAELTADKGKAEMRHYLYLAFFGFGVTAIATWLGQMLPPVPPVLSANTYKILIVTFAGIGLSFTRASRIPGSHALAMALVYLFVARMGAKADLSSLDESVFWFLLGAFVWIFIHGGFLVGAAKLFKVDVHTAAIASAANIGGAASAPIVAAHHKPTLVPVSILMALLGYAIGNPMAILAGTLCRLVG